MRICVQQDVPDEEECLVMAKRHVKDIIKRIDLEEIISLPRDGKQDDKKKAGRRRSGRPRRPKRRQLAVTG